MQCKFIDALITAIDEWIFKWSHHKSLRQLLNYILEAKPFDEEYIDRSANYKAITKAYRKAIMRIHPDKHVNSDFETRYKAAEMFKIVVQLYEKYKKKYG